jgi:phthalate 4,5-dioxygenase
MADVVFSGIPNEYFQAQDLAVTEPRAILDRTREHTGYADRAIVAARGMLLEAIKDVREGLDPPGVAREGSKNRFPLVLVGGTIPAAEDWRAKWLHATSAERES